MFLLLMSRRPPRSTRTDTLFPYTTLCLSHRQALVGDHAAVDDRLDARTLARAVGRFPEAEEAVDFVLVQHPRGAVVAAHRRPFRREAGIGRALAVCRQLPKRNVARPVDQIFVSLVVLFPTVPVTPTLRAPRTRRPLDPQSAG